MPRRSAAAIFSLAAALSPAALWAGRACIAPDQAIKHIGKDVCVTAHIYRVVDSVNGVHFLDACSPETPDADCHFFIVSLSQNEAALGDLQGLTGQTIDIHGTVHTVQSHAEMVLSSPEQLHGGKKQFHPNPQLAKSFSAENRGQAFSAHNGTGGQRGVHLSHRGR